MKQIVNADELVGKTLAQVAIQTWDNWVGLRFTDDTYIIIEASQSYDSVDLGIVSAKDREDYRLRDLGVISVDEFDARDAARKAAFAQSQRDREHNEYLRLAAKFAGVKTDGDV